MYDLVAAVAVVVVGSVNFRDLPLSRGKTVLSHFSRIATKNPARVWSNRYFWKKCELE